MVTDTPDGWWSSVVTRAFEAKVSEAYVAWSDLKALREDNARLTAEVKRVKLLLGKAAQEINCAGPVDHRIRIMRREHSELVDRLTRERDEARAHLAVIGQELGVEGRVATVHAVRGLKAKVEELERAQGTLVKLGQFIGDKLDGAWEERAEAAKAEVARLEGLIVAGVGPGCTGQEAGALQAEARRIRAKREPPQCVDSRICCRCSEIHTERSCCEHSPERIQAAKGEK